jgi:hypothetical protein
MLDSDVGAKRSSAASSRSDMIKGPSLGGSKEQSPTPDRLLPASSGGDPHRAKARAQAARAARPLPFHGEGYRKVWARLRYQGIRTSKDRVRLLMRGQGLQAQQRVGHPHGPKAHDGTILTDRPDELWGTDMTATVTTEEGQVCVFIAVDHCTAECIGIHASKRLPDFEAWMPIRQGVRKHFGGFKRGIALGLSIRHDHGSAYR